MDALNRWLDGDLDRDDLPEKLRDRAELWDRLRALAREEGERTRRADLPAGLEHAVMRKVRALAGRDPANGNRSGRDGGTVAGAWRWALRPRQVRVRPVTVGALLAAVLAVVLLWPDPDPAAPLPQPNGVRSATAQAAGTVYVQFVHVAPEAAAVTVAGDFNDWDERSFPLRDPDGDGIWTGYLPLAPGFHKYMFVVDGEWVTDPLAERHVDDGFGNQNALIGIHPPGSRI